MSPKISDILKAKFPILTEEELISEIEANCRIVKLEAGAVLMEIGSYIKQMPLLISGSIKITREDAGGNELLLYYLNSGETCTMSLICCMGDVKSNIRATTIDETELIMLPTLKLNEWMRKYESLRNFVFKSYQVRFEELLQTIDSIAFKKMDERLELYLMDRAKELNSKILNLTHQEIAGDMNTSREVVSRLLKQLERMGKIKLHRFKIEILSLM